MQAICVPVGFSLEIPGISATVPAEQCGLAGFRMAMPGITATVAEHVSQYKNSGRLLCRCKWSLDSVVEKDCFLADVSVQEEAWLNCYKYNKIQGIGKNDRGIFSRNAGKGTDTD